MDHFIDPLKHNINHILTCNESETASFLIRNKEIKNDQIFFLYKDEKSGKWKCKTIEYLPDDSHIYLLNIKQKILSYEVKKNERENIKYEFSLC